MAAVATQGPRTKPSVYILEGESVIIQLPVGHIKLHAADIACPKTMYARLTKFLNAEEATDEVFKFTEASTAITLEFVTLSPVPAPKLKCLLTKCLLSIVTKSNTIISLHHDITEAMGILICRQVHEILQRQNERKIKEAEAKIKTMDKTVEELAAKLRQAENERAMCRRELDLLRLSTTAEAEAEH